MIVLILLTIPLIVINPYFCILSFILIAINLYLRIGTNLTKSEKDANLTFFLYSKSMYLRSPLWSAKRAKVLQRDNYRCVLCDATDSLEVHHRKGYSDIPNEPLWYLSTLCRNCHQYQHDYYGYPKTLLDYTLWDTPLVPIQKS